MRNGEAWDFFYSAVSRRAINEHAKLASPFLQAHIGVSAGSLLADTGAQSLLCPPYPDEQTSSAFNIGVR